jgi:hypothetical protein
MPPMFKTHLWRAGIPTGEDRRVVWYNPVWLGAANDKHLILYLRRRASASSGDGLEVGGT